MFQRTCRVAAYALALLPFAALTTAAPREVAAKVNAGNAAYAAGDYPAALAAYDDAEVACPECAEIAYNRGLVYYQMRDFVKACDQFNSALQTRDLGLEARAKYNLGNVSYAQALEKLSAPGEAIELARLAIDHYRDALMLTPEDADARANIEIAQLFIKDMLDKQKQQQEENQDQQQSCDNPQQDDQQNDEQQNQDQEQQDEQQVESEKQEGQQSQDEQEQEGQEQESQQGEQEQQEESEQSGEQAGEQQEPKEGDDKQPSGQPEQAEPQPDQQEAQSARAEAREMAEEEVERLLQAARDRESQRRAERARKLNARRAPVTKDW